MTRPGPDPGDLAGRQAALVAALVAGGALPPGFDARRVSAVRAALLRKRAGEVARAWPVLAAVLGPRWPGEFVAWAAGRPPRGSLRDGWDFARALAAADSLPPAAAAELAARDAGWAYDGESAPRRRGWLPRRLGGAVGIWIGTAGWRGHGSALRVGRARR